MAQKVSQLVGRTFQEKGIFAPPLIVSGLTVLWPCRTARPNWRQGSHGGGGRKTVLPLPLQPPPLLIMSGPAALLMDSRVRWGKRTEGTLLLPPPTPPGATCKKWMKFLPPPPWQNDCDLTSGYHFDGTTYPDPRLGPSTSKPPDLIPDLQGQSLSQYFLCLIHSLLSGVDGFPCLFWESSTNWLCPILCSSWQVEIYQLSIG